MAVRQAELQVAPAHYSDDERSVAADSWSVKSEYGSTLDGDELRHSDAVDALASAASYSLSLRPNAMREDGYEKEEVDSDVEQAEPSALGLQSHWDNSYSEELANFYERGDAGEIWFGEDVMETVAAWTAEVCARVAGGLALDGDGEGLGVAGREYTASDAAGGKLSEWSVLDIGTGNGVFLHALAKQGFVDLTGTDYSDGAVELARAVAERRGISNITFLVDDVLESKLERQFQLVTDKGTLDAIGLHPDGRARRRLYWKSVLRLLAPGGVFVVTSCNDTKADLVADVDAFFRSLKEEVSDEEQTEGKVLEMATLRCIDYIRDYPTFRFGGREGSRVATVAFALMQ